MLFYHGALMLKDSCLSPGKLHGDGWKFYAEFVGGRGEVSRHLK